MKSTPPAESDIRFTTPRPPRRGLDEIDRQAEREGRAVATLRDLAGKPPRPAGRSKNR